MVERVKPRSTQGTAQSGAAHITLLGRKPRIPACMLQMAAFLLLLGALLPYLSSLASHGDMATWMGLGPEFSTYPKPGP